MVRALPVVVHLAACTAFCQVCPDGPLFDRAPMERGRYRAFRPLGWTSPLQHVFPAKHSSFSLAFPGEEPPVLPVTFPGSATVTRVSSVSVLDQTGEVKKTSWTLYFQPCREFTAYFNHLTWVPGKFSSSIDDSRCTSYVTNGTTVRNCQTPVQLVVESGEIAGLSGDSAAMDFGAVDWRIPPLGFANPKHYMPEMLQYVSPVPYFTPEARAELEEALRSWDGDTPRRAEPRYGAYMQDLPGTAQGNWFTGGLSLATPFQQPDPFLALVHDYVDPQQPIFSVGTSVKGLRPGIYAYTRQNEGRINRDFADIRADGEIYCFDSFGVPGAVRRTPGGLPAAIPPGVLLVDMPDADTLRLESVEGSSCAALGDWRLGEAATTFNR